MSEELEQSFVSMLGGIFAKAAQIEITRDGKFGNVTLKKDVWDAYVARLAALA